MKIKLIFIWLIIPFAFGCTNIKKFNLQDAINQKADNCENKNCTITITQLTNFKWDKMYVFNNATSPEEISIAIGIHYPYYKEFSKSIVFLYKNQIVHYENNEDNIETATNRSVIFDYPDSLGHQMYTAEQAKFKFIKIDFPQGSYIQLYK